MSRPTPENRIKPFVARPKGDDFYRNKILSKIVKDDNGCWNWPGFFHPLRGALDRSTGYGVLSYEGKPWRIHRLSYTLFKKPIPEGMIVLHKCDNPRCANPMHLELGTHQQNMDDMNDKGRNGYAKKTHCPRGHDFSIHGRVIKTPRRSGVGRQCCACALGRQRVIAGWPEDLAYSMPPTKRGYRGMKGNWKRNKVSHEQQRSHV